MLGFSAGSAQACPGWMEDPESSLAGSLWALPCGLGSCFFTHWGCTAAPHWPPSLPLSDDGPAARRDCLWLRRSSANTNFLSVTWYCAGLWNSFVNVLEGYFVIGLTGWRRFSRLCEN